RRIPPAKAGRPAPVGEDVPGKAAALGNGNGNGPGNGNGDGPGNGNAPAARRAVPPPGQPPLPSRRSRPAAQGDAPSPWFASAEAETAPAGPPAEERAESPEPADLPASELPRRPVPAAPASPGESRPDADDSGQIVHERPGAADAGGTTQAGLPRRVPRQGPGTERPQPRATEERPKPRGAGDEESARRNAGRTHSFLSNYQSGIRRGQPDGRDET
ncbi:hypothetical protein L4B83_27260, partial [Streptomyces sp. PSAA01]|nr:hypothetical protein [Streptomyces sp. PSAA01]